MPVRAAFRHWLVALNTALGVFLGGAFAAPILAALGWRPGADALYAAYHLTCHQWAFRSLFLFGQPQPVTVYNQQQLADEALDPFTFVGNPSLGWKMAFCERDLAIYVGLLLVGLLYARRRNLGPAGFALYGVLILPMALDGFTQLFGWRESTWELRSVTGLLFGLATAWLVLPRLDASFRPEPSATQYAPDARCEPAPPNTRFEQGRANAPHVQVHAEAPCEPVPVLPSDLRSSDSRCEAARNPTNEPSPPPLRVPSPPVVPDPDPVPPLSPRG
jgi:uncharacterized membrane protein